MSLASEADMALAWEVVGGCGIIGGNCTSAGRGAICDSLSMPKSSKSGALSLLGES